MYDSVEDGTQTSLEPHMGTARRGLGTLALLATASAGVIAVASVARSSSSKLAHSAVLPVSPAHLTTADTDLVSDELSFTVYRHGYPEMSEGTKTAYGGWDHIVEPDAPMILEVSKPADSAIYSWTVDQLDRADGTMMLAGSPVEGDAVQVRFKGTNNYFRIVLAEHVDGVNTRTVFKTRVVSKFVRREIRSISTPDREAFFSAMEVVFSVPTADGQELYGDDYFSYSWFVALHASSVYTYHGNLMFLTSHPAMQIKFEKSLRAVNSELVLPYWNFMLDSELDDWTTAVVYDKTWFGPTDTKAEDDFRPSGRFHSVKNVMDYGEIEFPESEHNAYYYVGQGVNPSAYLQRSNSNCGFAGVQGYSTCNDLKDCFHEFEYDNTSLYDLDACIENNVHGTLHIMHGGLWDCAVDLKSFQEDHSDFVSKGLMSFIANNIVTCENILGDSSCPSAGECTLADDDNTTETDIANCTCSSNIDGVTTVDDIDDLNASYVETLMSSCMSTLYTTMYKGTQYVSNMTKSAQGNGSLAESWRFLDDEGRVLTTEQNVMLQRLMLKETAFLGKYSTFNSGASPNDPLFWVMHQMFDRLTHVLRTSPRYMNKKLHWTPRNESDGTGWYSKTPFDYSIFDGFMNNSQKMTNKAMWKLLKPDGDSLNYVYDDLVTWGDCDNWDPMSQSTGRI